MEPRSAALEADALTTRPTRRFEASLTATVPVQLHHLFLAVVAIAVVTVCICCFTLVLLLMLMLMLMLLTQADAVAVSRTPVVSAAKEQAFGLHSVHHLKNLF